MRERKTCIVCGQNLHPANKTDRHERCARYSDQEPRPVGRPTFEATNDGLADFRILARALGYDPRELLIQLTEEWLRPIKETHGKK